MTNKEKKDKRKEGGAAETAVGRRAREAKEREAGEMEAEAQAEFAEALTAKEAEVRAEEIENRGIKWGREGERREGERLREKSEIEAGKKRIENFVENLGVALKNWVGAGWKLQERDKQMIEGGSDSLTREGKDDFERIVIRGGQIRGGRSTDDNRRVGKGGDVSFDLLFQLCKYDDKDPTGERGVSRPRSEALMAMSERLGYSERSIYDGTLENFIRNDLPRELEKVRAEYKALREKAR